MQNLKSSLKKNGLFVYYSHPKLVSDIRAEQLRQWTLSGEESKLERAILSGHGHRLMVETEALPLPQHLIQLVAKCDALHAAIEKGSLLELKNLLDNDYNRNKSVTCRDKAGVGLLHKAVFYNYMDIMEWLVKSYPHLVHQRDSAGRTALHYTAACRDEAAAAGLLERAGAARGARDAAGRTLAHYRAARTLLTLPAADMPQAARNPPGLVIKRHNIRIWCHECDMGRLQRVVWEGHGTRLLSEVSSQPIVKRFLEAVPYIMNTIRDIHQSVIQNDLEGLIKLTADPVSPQVFSSRDINGMTALHKAAGLGHCGILKYIIEKYPRGINEIDNDGRTSLHYAATVKDEQHTYSTLVGLGADESVVDNKNKSPGYYINRPQEIDKNIFKILPEAPRTPSSAYPLTWDWKLLEIEHLAETNKKNRKKNIKASNENISFKNNTNSTLSETTENQHSSMKNSSTHELINKLPELDDTEKFNTKIVEESTNEVSEIVDEKNLEENVHAVIKESDEINKDSLENITNDQYESIDTDTETCRNSKETLPNNDYADKDEEVEQKSDNKNIGELGHENVSDSCEVQKICENSIDSITANQDANRTDDGMSCDRNKDVFEHKDDSNNNDTKNNESEIINELEEYPVVQINNHSIVSTELTDLDKDQQNDQNFEVHNTSNGEFLKEKQETVARVSSPELTKYERIPKKSASTIALEGNNNSYHSEDDDDVQVQEKSNIETIETNFSHNPEVLEIDSTKEGNLDNGRLTQESLIEGIISGDAEQDSQDASITQKDEPIHGEILIVDNEIDPEVTSLINSANMEMLATLVLNGEGSRLIGRQSQNAELQSFLENVPTYMQKINRVHIAAKEGNIRDLQTALDRRKFAIARDPISPNGATPLHVATVYGKTNIIKYLGGRFPETLSAVDFEGRTALHYAAVIPDNGYYYNLMQQLGANAKDLDDNGNSAEDYLRNPNLFPYEQLLNDYGISHDIAQNMLSDKGKNLMSNGHMDIPVFHTEEGRYLAKSLGDPLIKGLTEVANIKPKDPVAFLATFLHNFPENEKPRLNTQESIIMTSEAPEVENDHAVPESPPLAASPAKVRSATRTATRPNRPIDVITLDPKTGINSDAPEMAFSSISRDEHGQSMLHFAAARTHANNALFQLLQETDVSLGYRDELYRTARDVSIQANVPENTVEIDKWVLHLAARGKSEKIMELLLQGYDHILDIGDAEGVTITEVVTKRGDIEMSNLLKSIPAFEESREALQSAVRQGNLSSVQNMVKAEGGATLAGAHNSFGRTALHIAVLAQHEDIVAYLAETFPELLRIGDNLERTPLHYAMGVEKIESLSRVLIRAGSKRVLKDLKGRQPSYYFMNKSDILRLKEEEESY